MTGVDLRAATPDDAGAIARIYVDTWRATYAGILPDDALVRMSYDVQARQWRALLQAGDAALVATVAHSNIIGFTGYGPSRSRGLSYSGEVYTLYVAPDHQNHGWGRRLLRGAFRDLSRGGHESAIIWVLGLNPSRFFYERQGGAKVVERDESVWGVREFGYGWPRLAETLS
ncbi:MAG: GNAT family N-acetyltransferase [Alphaproteobacteria bacterium]|nr:GNAT family N-acetyltransferase [Alphaproteobacteria bacterium]